MHIVAWRMLLTGEVYRAAKSKVIAPKQRLLQKMVLRLISHTETPGPTVAEKQPVIPQETSQRVESGNGQTRVSA